MAFCEQCGNTISETAKFCGKCGTPVTSGEAQMPQQEEISAPFACAQCGVPLEEGEAFCANCGAKVGAAPAQAPRYQPAPVQAQRQAGGDGVLKEGEFSINKSEVGRLLLYKDRLEWHGGYSLVIPLREISSIRVTLFRISDVIIINMVNGSKYELTDKPNQVTWTIDMGLHSWVNDINHLRKLL